MNPPLPPTPPRKSALPEQTARPVYPRFTISVVCFNNLELTKKCLRSVLQWSTDFELIVTDNASNDGTGEALKELAGADPRVRVVSNHLNTGFSLPNNEALKRARGEFLVLLNNDMEACEGWLEKLVEPFEDATVGITGMAGTCARISETLRARPILPTEKDQEPEYVEGSCLMIPTALARRLSLFSDYLQFAYWEDTDLSLRVREAGYKLVTVEVAMQHKQRGSTARMVSEVQQFMDLNTEEMKRRWAFYWKRRDLKRRILVRRLGAHGDVLLTTPALWELRKRYPLAEIDVVTKCPNMLAGLEWVSIAKRARNYYDTFYDLDRAYEERPDLHIVEAFAQRLNVTLPKRWQMFMAASPTDTAWAERTARGSKLAIVHAGPTTWPSKNWPVERWSEVVRALRKKGYVVASVGAVGAANVDADLHLAGETTPQQLYALLIQSHLFVGIDSMPQHIASCANTPSVVLFGPTNPKCITRPSPRVIPVQGDVKEVPCIGEHGRRTTPITSVPCDGECIRAITPAMVLAAVERVERLSV